MSNRPFAVVSGASTGIGYELAKRCAEEGYDLLIVADEPKVETSAQALRAIGVEVEALQADLATFGGVERVRAAINIRPVDALLANAALSVAASRVLPSTTLAEHRRGMTERGSADR